MSVRRAVQGAGSQAQSGLHRVDVPVDEARNHRPAVEPDHDRAGADERADLLLGADGDDALIEDGDRPGGRSGDRVHGAASEDEVGRAGC